MRSRPSSRSLIFFIAAMLGLAGAGCMDTIETPDGRIGSFLVLRDWLDLSYFTPLGEESLTAEVIERFPIGSLAAALLEGVPGQLLDNTANSPDRIVLIDYGYGFPCGPAIFIELPVASDGTIEDVIVTVHAAFGCL